jgi:hypothetical protein
MCHGGMSRAVVFVLIDRAYGRTSSYVISDIGALESGRWQFWQERCRIGATSFVNVTAVVAEAVGDCAFGATVTSMTRAAAPAVRALIPPSTFYFSLFTLEIFSASNDL